MILGLLNVNADYVKMGRMLDGISRTKRKGSKAMDIRGYNKRNYCHCPDTPLYYDNGVWKFDNGRLAFRPDADGWTGVCEFCRDELAVIENEGEKEGMVRGCGFWHEVAMRTAFNWGGTTAQKQILDHAIAQTIEDEDLWSR